MHEDEWTFYSIYYLFLLISFSIHMVLFFINKNFNQFDSQIKINYSHSVLLNIVYLRKIKEEIKGTKKNKKIVPYCLFVI